MCPTTSKISTAKIHQKPKKPFFKSKTMPLIDRTLNSGQSGSLRTGVAASLGMDKCAQSHCHHPSKEERL